MPDITDLAQHLNAIKHDLNRYKLKCSHCGMNHLWNHGFYYRKTDRHGGNKKSCNPVPIPRFICKYCKKTISVLPECISPRRWYMWSIQQAVMLKIILGTRIRAISKKLLVSRSTCRRWYKRFKSQYLHHSSILRNHYPKLGLHEDFNKFWAACLKAIPLSKAMLLCNLFGVRIP